MDDIREFGPLKCLAPTSYRPFLATSSGQTVMSSGDLSIVSEFPRRLLSIESIKPRMSDVVFEIKACKMAPVEGTFFSLFLLGQLRAI